VPDPPIGPRLAPGQFRFDPAVVSVYESNLTAMIRFSRKHGIEPVVVTFVACDDPRRTPDQQRSCFKYVFDNMPQLDVGRAQEGMDLYRQVTREVARRENAPLIDAASKMPKDLALFADTVHLVPEGEEQLARVIAPELLDLLRARERRPRGELSSARGRVGADGET
jgi:lysophospholipase L1-like esterase